MYLRLLSPYLFFFCWIFLAIFPYIYNTNFFYEPLLIYFTGSALYYAYYALTNYHVPVYFKVVFAFACFLSFYGIALIFLGDDVVWLTAGKNLRKYLYILWLVSSLLSVFPVYVFTCRGQLSEKGMKILFFLFLAASIYGFYGALKEQIMYAALMHTGQEEYTITAVYSFLSLLPLIVLFKKNQALQFILLAIMLFYFVMSSKRGAIILAGITSILLIVSMVFHNSDKKKIITIAMTSVLMVVAFVFISHQIETSAYFSARLDQTVDGYTSRREEYVKILLDYYFNNTTLGQFFTGIGAQGTLSVNESFAHNDWVAILLEQGLFGALFYLLYWLTFVYTWVKSRVNYDAFVVIGLLIVVGFGKTLFSMYYLPISAEMMISSGYFAIALGYFLGKAFPQEDEESDSLVDETVGEE